MRLLSYNGPFAGILSRGRDDVVLMPNDASASSVLAVDFQPVADVERANAA
jgi:hypothetical protein